MNTSNLAIAQGKDDTAFPILKCVEGQPVEPASMTFLLKNVGLRKFMYFPKHFFRGQTQNLSFHTVDHSFGDGTLQAIQHLFNITALF